MPTIHRIQTGWVKIKTAQASREGNGGIRRILVSRTWTDWLPINAWVIEHPEGMIIVDTGETARTSQSGYFPRWHPYFRLAVRMNVGPQEEIGPQMRAVGLDPQAAQKVVLTHLHTDHAGGLAQFPNAQVLVSADEHRSAQGVPGMLQGYLPHRWPKQFVPSFIRFQPKPVGPFEESYPVTDAADVVIVPTPGHTPSHISVIVKVDGSSYFLAGDTSYSEELLRERHPDGVSPDAEVALRTIDRILRYAEEEPTVYLPSHDPESGDRLKHSRLLKPAA